MNDNDGLLNEREVQGMTKLSRTTRWRMEKRGEFPKRRQLSPNRVGWKRSEILAWIAQRETGVLPQPAALHAAQAQARA